MRLLMVVGLIKLVVTRTEIKGQQKQYYYVYYFCYYSLVTTSA